VAVTTKSQPHSVAPRTVPLTTRIDPHAIVYRPMQSEADYAQCVELQQLTWGQHFNDVVPESVVKISQKIGGIAAGAFLPDGRMLGFVWGLSGLRSKRLAHWSHMLAVRPEAQGLGLGRELKRYQRELLLEMGIDVMFWTFDPLVARNANLNLNRLGATVDEYVENMYGTDSGSDLHSGLGTDRWIARWELRDPRPAEPDAPVELLAPPCVNSDPAAPEPRSGDLPDVARVRVEVPANIEDVNARSKDAGWQWRLTTRRAFQWYLPRGYRVTRFVRDPSTNRYYYLLERA
jgi:predicted GNAT superfamily acetyltransferase